MLAVGVSATQHTHVFLRFKRPCLHGGNVIFTAALTERITHYTLQAKSCAKGVSLWISQQQERRYASLYRVAYLRLVVSSPFRSVCVLVHSSEPCYPTHPRFYIRKDYDLEDFYAFYEKADVINWRGPRKASLFFVTIPQTIRCFQNYTGRCSPRRSNFALRRARGVPLSRSDGGRRGHPAESPGSRPIPVDGPVPLLPSA